MMPNTEPDQALLDRALAYSIWSARAYRDKLYRLPGQAAGNAQAGASSSSSTETSSRSADLSSRT